MPRDRKPVEPEQIVGQRNLRALLARASALPGQPGANVTVVGPAGPIDDILGHTSMGNIHQSGVPHLDKPKPPAGRIVKYKNQLSKEADERQRRSDE